MGLGVVSHYRQEEKKNNGAFIPLVIVDSCVRPSRDEKRSETP